MFTGRGVDSTVTVTYGLQSTVSCYISERKCHHSVKQTLINFYGGVFSNTYTILHLIIITYAPVWVKAPLCVPKFKGCK